jgi:hypothetical protein
MITAVGFGRSVRTFRSNLPFLHPENHNTVRISNIGRNLAVVHVGLLVDKVALKFSEYVDFLLPLYHSTTDGHSSCHQKMV